MNENKRKITSVSLSSVNLLHADYIMEQTGVGSRSAVIAMALAELYDKQLELQKHRSGEAK